MNKKQPPTMPGSRGFPPLTSPLPPPPAAPPSPKPLGSDPPRTSATSTMTLPLQNVLDQCSAEIGRLNLRILVQAEEIKSLRGRIVAMTQELDQLRKRPA